MAQRVHPTPPQDALHPHSGLDGLQQPDASADRRASGAALRTASQRSGLSPEGSGGGGSSQRHLSQRRLLAAEAFQAAVAAEGSALGGSQRQAGGAGN